MRTRFRVAVVALLGMLACKGDSQPAREPLAVAAKKQEPAGEAPAVAPDTQEQGAVVSGDHAVLVEFYSAADVQRIARLENELRAAIATAKVGELDGNELAVDGTHGRLYMYGPDADRLFDVVRPILEASPLMKGATAVKRYGPATSESAKETRVKLGAPEQ